MIWRQVIKNSLLNFLRNGFLTVATVAVMVLTILSVSIMLTTNLITDTAITLINQQIDISVDVLPAAGEGDVGKIVSELKKLDFVRDARYISKEEALENFKKRHGDIVIDEEVGNPLPARIAILSTDPKYHPQVITFLERYYRFLDINQVQSDVEYKHRTEQLINITEAIRRFGLVLSVFFLVVAFFIILNTIRITIYSRRDEIEIMRLVGADYGFIRLPFILEGMWYGVAGMLISLVIFYPAIYYISPQISSYLDNIVVGYRPESIFALIFRGQAASLAAFMWQQFLVFFLFTLLVGVILGAVSSYLATWRYMKETNL